MKSPNLTTVVLILIIVALSIACIKLTIKKNEVVDVLKKPSVELQKQNDEVARRKDPITGAGGVTYKDRIITKYQQIDGTNPAYIDSIAKALNIKASQLNESAQIIGKLQGKIKAYEVRVDSLSRREYFFKQKYLSAKFAEKDSTLTYAYDAELSVSKTTKKNILGRVVERGIDISSPDSNFTITGLKQFSIKEPVKKKPFRIGLQAGYYYDPIRGGFFKGVGVGLGYKLIGF